MAKKKSKHLAKWVENVIKDFIADSPDNTMKDPSNEKAFEDFLLGFSRGDDPLFEAYKEHVGPFHWTPMEIFSQTFPGIRVKPEKLTIISWVLLQREITKADNRKEAKFPSERWARVRIYGEQFNAKLRAHVAATLQGEGYEAVAPQLSPQWERKDSEKFVYASTWSERHVAHASGLGTFGLCDGLITERGKAMRLGSVVAHIQIPPTPRPYKDHREYCLFFTKGICGKCISRCPVGALSEEGHDKVKCREHLRPASAEYVKSHFGFAGYGCGLCQTRVPCESKVPKKKDVDAHEFS